MIYSFRSHPRTPSPDPSSRPSERAAIRRLRRAAEAEDDLDLLVTCDAALEAEDEPVQVCLAEVARRLHCRRVGVR
jgi:hypothetical protein